ncbi:unnamed protein product [Schistosoma rodhaini]|uniref:Small vasohibin-binding protein n=2 Tax=Schistosoma rodhaini TaxID=6188 RepID=A0AA85ENW6_9TREM|nr:unnamed protein product [Schistosoma rodhaini]CAH8681557.1 unnamed protein product [Schistosoma rodhaini]
MWIGRNTKNESFISNSKNNLLKKNVHQINHGSCMDDELTQNKKAPDPNKKMVPNGRQRHRSCTPVKLSRIFPIHKPNEVCTFKHLNQIRGLTDIPDDYENRPKNNFSQQLSTQQINKSNRSKSIPSISTRKSEFLSNEEDRALFAKQRSIIYQLNEIMRKSEIANYEAFMNLNHTK